MENILSIYPMKLSDEKKIMLKMDSYSLTWCHKGYYVLHIKSEIAREDWEILEAVVKRITPDWVLVEDIRKDYEKERVWTEEEKWYSYGNLTQIMVPKIKRTAYYYFKVVSVHT